MGIVDRAKAFARVGVTKAGKTAGDTATKAARAAADAAAKGAAGLDKAADRLPGRSAAGAAGQDPDEGTTR